MFSLRSGPALGSPASTRRLSRACAPKGLKSSGSPCDQQRSQAVLSPSAGRRISTSVSPVSSVRMSIPAWPAMSTDTNERGSRAKGPVLAGHPELAAVGEVRDADPAPHGLMLGSSVPVVRRHVPAALLDEGRSALRVLVVEARALHGECAPPVPSLAGGGPAERAPPVPTTS